MRRRISGWFISLALVPLGLLAVAAAAEEPLAGRTAASRLDLSGAGDAALAADLATFESTDGAAEFDWTMKKVAGPASEGGAIYDLTFPSPRPSAVPENNTVYCRFYPPRGVAPGVRAPAAIVLHHLGGSFAIEAVLADYLARSGIAALEVEFPYYGARRPADRKAFERGLLQADFEASVTATRQAVADIRRAADWLLARADIDPERTGVVGVSLGGIVGSLAAGVDPRLKRNVFVIAGGDLPAIVLNESRETRRAREVLKERGLGREEIAAGLAAIEPARFARRIDPRGALMLNASMDEVIPRSSTEKLWEAASRPEIVWYDSGHPTIAVYLMDVLARTRRHFLRPAAEARAGREPATGVF